MPRSAKRDFIAKFEIAPLICMLSFVMISNGVFFGVQKTPVQKIASKPGKKSLTRDIWQFIEGCRSQRQRTQLCQL